MSVATFTKTGNKATTTAKLDKSVFGVEAINHELLKSAYVAYLANGRNASATTKRRGEVRGGGKKPWKQKGTGRARFGSSRNPIWRGGGIAFGPTGEQNYTHKLHVKAKRQATRQALSLVAKESRLMVIEDLVIKDNRTAESAKLLSKIGATGQTLLVVSKKTGELERAIRNLVNVQLVSSKLINTYDVMNADFVVMTSEALREVTGWLGDKA